MRSAYEITLFRRVLRYLNHKRIAAQVKDALRESRRAGEQENWAYSRYERLPVTATFYFPTFHSLLSMMYVGAMLFVHHISFLQYYWTLSPYRCHRNLRCAKVKV
jgi:hypothetical protein